MLPPAATKEPGTSGQGQPKLRQSTAPPAFCARRRADLQCCRLMLLRRFSSQQRQRRSCQGSQRSNVCHLRNGHSNITTIM